MSFYFVYKIFKHRPKCILTILYFFSVYNSFVQFVRLFFFNFQNRADDRRGSVQLKKALAFQRREKGNHNVFAPGRSAWENNNGFVPLKIKQDLKDGCEYRVTKSMRKRDAKTENQEYNRVAGKTKQQLIYSQCQMESQGYLNRQRGIGTGVGGLRSEARRINMGGVQAAHIIRGTETPWLG